VQLGKFVSCRAGISPGTVRDVKRRLVSGGEAPARSDEPDLALDPALAATDAGRDVVAWMEARGISPADWGGHVNEVPLSRIYVVAAQARAYAAEWGGFADALEARVSRGRRR
jgi:hypothetical protein